MGLENITIESKGARKRRFDDACGLAHGLDLVGERWALNILRELLLGPRRFSDLRAALPGLSANVLTQRLRRPTRRALFLRAAEIYAERHADADGRLRATFEFIWLSGWVPHESQQKPLQPGSAKMRLADALGVKEGKL